MFMRFQRNEDLAKFYENPFYTKVLQEHVMPYCHVCLSCKHQYLRSYVHSKSPADIDLILCYFELRDFFSNSQGILNFDYETEVEDDILPIFRKGEVRIC